MSTSKNKKNEIEIDINFFLKQLQKVKDKSKLSWGDFYNYAGFTRSAWSKWKNKERSPSAKQLNIITQNLDCDLTWLIKNTGKPPKILRLDSDSKTIIDPFPIPIIGKIPAGMPNEIQENIIGYDFTTDPNLKDCYCLRVKGMSMYPLIHPGDIVLFKLGTDISDGDLVIVNDPSGESMLKRYRKSGEKEWLQSDNPEYPSIMHTDVFFEYRIIGKVIKIHREITNFKERK